MRALPLVLALAAAAATAAPAGATDCAALGFTDALVCSACGLLEEELPGDDELAAECRACCAEDAAGGNASESYSAARLSVCR